MSKQSERLHVTIVETQKRLNCGFFDACIVICEENELDPEDFAKQLDSVTLDRLRQSAIDDRLLRKKDCKADLKQLPFK